MLTLKDVVYVKDAKRVIADVPFDRVYLQYGPQDRTEKRESKAVSVEADGTLKTYTHTVEVPVGVEVQDANGAVLGVVSVHDANELFADAIAYLQTRTSLNPVWVVLDKASGDLNLELRKPIHEANRPKKIKVVSVDQAKAKMCGLLVASGMAPNLEAAEVMVTLVIREQQIKKARGSNSL